MWTSTSESKVYMNPINTLWQSILCEIFSSFKHKACAAVDGNRSMRAARLNRKESWVFFPLTLFCADCWSGVWITGRQSVTGSVNWQRELRDVSLPITHTGLEKNHMRTISQHRLPLNTTTQKKHLTHLCSNKVHKKSAAQDFLCYFQHKIVLVFNYIHYRSNVWGGYDF